jgi:uncharacterized protein (DUF302 family)
MAEHTHAPEAARAQEGTSHWHFERRRALLAVAGVALGIACTLVLTKPAPTAVRFIDSTGAEWIRSAKRAIEPGAGFGELSAAQGPTPRHDDAAPCWRSPHARPPRLLVRQMQEALRPGVDPDLALPARPTAASDMGESQQQEAFPTPERPYMTSPSPQGLVEAVSAEAFVPTLERLTAAIENAGLYIFARIDHTAAARESGLQMPPTVVLIYGHGRGGTPIMLAAPSAALELPLRVLVREGKEGQVVVSFLPVGPMLRALGVPAELLERLEPAQRLILETVQGKPGWTPPSDWGHPRA